MRNELSAISRYATFRLHELLLGIEVIHVQEVLRYQEMTAIPLAPSAVHGLINLRGQIVTAIDTRRGLKLPPRPDSALPMNIIVRYGEDLVSLLVDDIGEVVDVPHTAYASIPENMPADQRELIKCVYHFDHALMLVLDTERLMANACN